MLANDDDKIYTGELASGLHRPYSWLHELISFVVEQLPIWRDRKDRPYATNETTLTSQLCAHLNSATRKHPGWDTLQFRTEEPDEIKAARKIDLVPTPSDQVIWIEGRKYTDFSTLLPIECKRLPTPKGRKKKRRRDKREYLHVLSGSTGGVQRFKLGHHGAAHNIAAMIGYVQAGDIQTWVQTLDFWVRVLARARVIGWTIGDRLKLIKHNKQTRVAELESDHARVSTLLNIRIRHVWIEMTKHYQAG